MNEQFTLPLQALAAAGGLVAALWLGSGLLARDERAREEQPRGADPLDPW